MGFIQLLTGGVMAQVTPWLMQQGLVVLMSCILAAPMLAQLLGGGPESMMGNFMLAVVAAVSFATIVAVVAGLTLSGDGALLLGDETLLQTKVADGRISPEDHYRILGIVAERVPDRAGLSVRYARSIDIDRMGTLALACKAARNVGEVLTRVALYHTLLSNSIRYHVESKGNHTLLRQEVLVGSGPVIFSTVARGGPNSEYFWRQQLKK